MEQKFRLDGKAFFLTYPQCNLARDVVLQCLRDKFKDRSIDNYCVAIEEHEDGNPHIHALIVLDKKKTIASAKYFDIAGFHGNYQTARNRVKIFDYITKSDPTVLTNMDATSLRVKSMTRQEIGKRLIQGEEPQDLLEEYPQLIFGFKRLQDDIQAYKICLQVPCVLPPFLPNDWGFVIPTHGRGKRRHLWYWSSQPNKGKTTWAKRLEKEYGAYIKSSEFAYWNVTGKESLIILDDYNTAGLRYNSLNQLCDGNYEARVFMGGVRRVVPKLVIVLSNVNIVSLYPNMFHLLQARFIEKELL